jgi:large subunit ribosomal protein L4
VTVANAKVLDMQGKNVASVELPAALFDVEPKQDVVHQYVKRYLANQRQGTHSTLSRSEMKGGGIKPFRQKGTGRARQGSNISPLMPGGARAFGPSPRDYRQAMPAKMRRQALRACLSGLARDQRVLVLEGGELEKPRTKTIVAFLKGAGLEKSRTLILSEGKELNFALSCRNLPHVRYKRAANVNAYDLADCDTVVFTRAGLAKAQEVFQ